MGILPYSYEDDRRMEKKITAFRNQLAQEKEYGGFMGAYPEEIKGGEKTDGFVQNIVQHERRQTMAMPRDLSEKIASGMRKTMAAGEKK